MQILQDYSLLQIQMRNYEAFNVRCRIIMFILTIINIKLLFDGNIT